MTKHEHEEEMVEEMKTLIGVDFEYRGVNVSSMVNWLMNKLRSHATLVEAETVERCIETIKSYRISDWSSEQAIYEQLEEIIAAIRALQGKNENV